MKDLPGFMTILVVGPVLVLCVLRVRGSHADLIMPCSSLVLKPWHISLIDELLSPSAMGPIFLEVVSIMMISHIKGVFPLLWVVGPQTPKPSLVPHFC